MKPAAFDYARPPSLDDAIRLLADGDGAAMPISGGQSLLILMGLRMTMIDTLVDVTQLQELKQLRDDGDGVFVGALTTHATIEDGKIPDPSAGLLARVASKIAYRAVRNLGTIGGSVALADPAADWPACLIALGAEVCIVGPGGERRERVEDFVRGAYETSLATGEIVVGFQLPRREATRWGISKVSRKSGAFADSMAVAVEATDGAPRVALAGTASRALHLPQVSLHLQQHRTVDAAELATVIRAELAELVPDADPYQLRCHVATISRAIAEARA
ncbi:MAG: FAD binding domain-containing protein [Tardiphaga sp.]